MRMHEIDAELDIMQRAGRSRKEIRRRQREWRQGLWSWRIHNVAYLESKTKRAHRRIPRPEEDGFLNSESLHGVLY